ncbi:MAG: phosphate acyltransferase, partial [Polaromonas sp.]|nr:phosphate acyltransferase [Polaromonas sp.]
NRAYDAARNNLLDRVQERIAHAAPLLAKAAMGPVDATGAEAVAAHPDPAPAH